MGQNFILNNEYFLKINSISNSNTQKINSEIKPGFISNAIDESQAHQAM